MSTATSHTNAVVAARKSLPLTERDIADLDRLLGSAAHKAALQNMYGAVRESSESQGLHALLVIGLRRVEDAVAEQSYAAEAEEQRATRAQRQRAARRRAGAGE